MFELETYLKDFHDRNPGASAQVFAGTTGDGRSSYERLAVALDAKQGERVLDLACGDGPLLDALRELHGDAVTLEGVDMSATELASARRRLGPGVLLHEGRAQELHHADGALDRVGCHMAFMLMAPLGEVVAELGRVIRPGGRFAASIGAAADDAPHEALFWEALSQACRASGFRPPRLGDPALHEAGLEELFAGPLWSDVREESFTLVVEVPREGLWRFFQRAFYVVDQLPDAAQDSLRRAIEEDGERFAPTGTMAWTFGVRQFVVDRVRGVDVA